MVVGIGSKPPGNFRPKNLMPLCVFLPMSRGKRRCACDEAGKTEYALVSCLVDIDERIERTAHGDPYCLVCRPGSQGFQKPFSGIHRSPKQGFFL